MSKSRKSLFVAALCAAASAQATETFDFTMAGNGTTFVDGNRCGRPGCPQAVTYSWLGSGSVTTSSGADGTYSGDDLVSFSAQAHPGPGASQYAVFGFNFKTDGSHPFLGSGPEPSVTISGGQIVAIDASGVMIPETLTLSFFGLNVKEDGTSFHAGTTHDVGTITPTMPVPEPETWALLVAGAGAVGVVRRKSRWAQPQRLLLQQCTSQTCGG
jgi:hypothetical protein